MGDPMDYHYNGNEQRDVKNIQVIGVPGCLFNGVQVCLSIKGKKNLWKLKIMAARFNKWYNEMAANHSHIEIPTSIGRPMRLN